MTHIRQLAQATDRQFPADEFHRAREIRRKVIMHVGPTNSGKTHHALRALAAAKTGVYAGPLRLLAHEIWERLNTGQIVPLGAEEEPVKKVSKVDSTIGIVPSQTTVRRVGNPKYARLCNMVTGEEQKLMGADVPLLSCTVEMLSFTQTYDVAVVDEIQMVGDLERGGGWVNAVLGLSAHELHLCGEETAVPIVEALLRDTGDELVVRRYERLTPLVVEAESLGGDLTKIKKGDCIVTFTRSNIFGIKRAVEEKTGMRCAVVYGRLPPEVRSEQAALFNDPDSGYDVIIGSDAIGMGLNLKIKRVVFEAVSKFSLTGHKRLAVSQVKQIAGRAGRYGLHQDGEAGGLTTTLHAPDLAYLRECVATPFTPLQSCRIGFTRDTFEQVSSALPMDASIDTVIDAHRYIGRIPSFLQYSTVDQSKSACDYINREWSDMSSGDRIMLMFAPIPWRDEMAAEFIRQILRVHRNQMSVDFMGAVKNTHFIEVMKLMEERMSKDDPPRSTTDGLMVLESLHKVIVMYIWMSFRNPVVYAQYEEVAELKTRLEAVLNWCLEGITQQGKTYWPTKKIHRPMDSFSVQTKRHMIIKENEKRQAASPRPRFGIKNPVSHAA
ncbi:P-loop containing nucleoside triphosphate hydrolase protein [Crassisporium funariophilum]|nr:P-loop containing nucleoside triphosphate hydrolase protein [Crassisporium funariophilum]